MYAHRFCLRCKYFHWLFFCLKLTPLGFWRLDDAVKTTSVWYWAYRVLISNAVRLSPENKSRINCDTLSDFLPHIIIYFRLGAAAAAVEKELFYMLCSYQHIENWVLCMKIVCTAYKGWFFFHRIIAALSLFYINVIPPRRRLKSLLYPLVCLLLLEPQLFLESQSPPIV